MSSLLKVSKVELLEKISIKIDKSLISITLPERLILYTVDSSHLILATEPIHDLEMEALSKNDAKSTLVGNEYLIELPKKIYDFYHMDEADYTIMVSEITPKAIDILL